MSKQQMPIMKCSTSSNTERPEELCGSDASCNREQVRGDAAKVLFVADGEKKRPAWKIRAGRRVRKEISGGRENWTLRHCVSFRRHCCRDSRRHRRCCAGFRRHYGFHRHRHHLPRHRHSCGSVQSRNATELDSCGSARNTFAAPTELNPSVRAADCRSAAAKSRGCHCTPGYHVASAAAARKNAHCWNRFGGCCCWAPRAVRPGRWRLQTAHSSVPMADDWHRCALFAREGSRGDWSFRNLPAPGRHPLRFLGRPKKTNRIAAARRQVSE